MLFLLCTKPTPIVYAASPKYSLDPDYLKIPAGCTVCVTFTVICYPPLADDANHILNKVDGGTISERFVVETNRITFHAV